MQKKTPLTLFKLKKSNTHNRGLFAAQDIAKDTRIVEYIGEKLTKAQAECRAEKREKYARSRGLGYVYIFTLNKRYDLDGNVKENIARFINHSCRPNCEAVNIGGHIWIIAIRNIKAGEELSYDYGYDIEDFLEHPCYCNASNCVGYIVAKDQRARVKRLISGS